MIELKRIALILVTVTCVSNAQIWLSLQIEFFKPYLLYVPFIALSVHLVVFKKNDGYVIDSTKLLWWIFGLIFLSAVSAGFHDSTIPNAEQIKSNIWVLLVMLSIVFVVNNKEDRDIVLKGIFVGVVFVGVSLYIELLSSYDFYPVNPSHEGRLSGLYANPNTSGLVMVLAGFLGQFHLQTKHRLYLYTFLGIAIFFTFSRSAILLFFVSFIYSWFSGFFGKINFTRTATALTIALAAVVLAATGEMLYLINLLGLSDHFSDDVLKRFSRNIVTHQDASSTQRIELLKIGFDIYAKNPIFGVGLGHSLALHPLSIGSHNMFVRFMIEMGSVGLLYFVSLIFVASNNRISFGFLVLFFASCIFNHTNLDYVVFSIILPIGLTMMRNSPKMITVGVTPSFCFVEKPTFIRKKLVRKMRRIKIVQSIKKNTDAIDLTPNATEEEERIESIANASQAVKRM